MTIFCIFQYIILVDYCDIAANLHSVFQIDVFFYIKGSCSSQLISVQFEKSKTLLKAVQDMEVMCAFIFVFVMR